MAPEGFSERRWTLTKLLHPSRREFWLCYPAANTANFHQIKVCDHDGYDFARLVWQTCDACQYGFIAKIRVTNEWQRKRYGTRMVMRALRDHSSYRWGTTPQSNDAQQFFPVLRAATGAAFHPKSGSCEHMDRGRHMSRNPSLESRPPLTLAGS